jgi:hypothetical protein
VIMSNGAAAVSTLKALCSDAVVGPPILFFRVDDEFIGCKRDRWPTHHQKMPWSQPRERKGPRLDQLPFGKETCRHCLNCSVYMDPTYRDARGPIPTKGTGGRIHRKMFFQSWHSARGSVPQKMRDRRSHSLPKMEQ